MRIGDDEDAVRPCGREPNRPHEEASKDASLDVERVRWELVYVGGVDDVGVCDEGIGDGREQLCRRRRVSGVASDSRADAGRDDEDGDEGVGSSEGAAPELEDRACPHTFGGLNALQHAELDAVARVARGRDSETQRHEVRMRASGDRRRQVGEERSMPLDRWRFELELERLEAERRRTGRITAKCRLLHTAMVLPEPARAIGATPDVRVR